MDPTTRARSLAAVAAAAIALGLTGPAAGAEAAAVVLRYLNAPAPGAPIDRPPTLGLSFGGRMIRAVMDTGSTGVVVAARSIPGVDALPVLGPGTLTYTSSGRIMRGDWVVTALTLHGADGTGVTTRPLPVLAVRRVDCLRTARNCRPRLDPRGIAMLGVGFAREADRQSQGTPDRNPFLSLPAMGSPGAPGAMRRGYVVSREAVLLGPSSGDMAGFARVQLRQSPDVPDWAPIPACLSLGGRPPACGTALVDTGVTSMYLTLPPDQLSGQTAPGPDGKPEVNPGIALAVTFGAAPDGPSYSFAAGGAASPGAPERVVLVTRAGRVFVNTGVRLLNGFDYLYDADAGAVGFRPRR